MCSSSRTRSSVLEHSLGACNQLTGAYSALKTPTRSVEPAQFAEETPPVRRVHACTQSFRRPAKSQFFRPSRRVASFQLVTCNNQIMASRDPNLFRQCTVSFHRSNDNRIIDETVTSYKRRSDRRCSGVFQRDKPKPQYAALNNCLVSVRFSRVIRMAGLSMGRGRGEARLLEMENHEKN